MMTTADLIYQKSQVMPESLREEVLHYMDYLLQKWQTPVQQPKIVADTEEDKSQKILALMTEIANRGTAFAEIDDVMAWQKEVRQDRPLPFRE